MNAVAEGVDTSWANVGVVNYLQLVPRKLMQIIGRLSRLKYEGQPPAQLVIPVPLNVNKILEISDEAQRKKTPRVAGSSAHRLRERDARH